MSGFNVMNGTSNSEVLIGSIHDDIFWAYGGHDTVYGQRGDDHADLGDGNDRFEGHSGILDGNDVVSGGAGHDTIWGGGGNDTVSGGTGFDYLYGGDGLDTISFLDGHKGFVIDLGLGWAQATGVWEVDQFSGFERVIGSRGDDSIYGDNGSNRLKGAGGDDVISGGNGHDRIEGGNGEDDLFGNAGHDILEGGRHDDLLFGMAGRDTLDGGRGDDFISGGNGDDLIRASTGLDTLQGDGGFDFIDFSGAKEQTYINLGAGYYYLGKHSGDFTSIEGAVGSDFSEIIFGSNVDNQIYGGGGDDLVIALLGDNTLYGGSGDDTLMVDGGASGAYFGDSGIDTLDFSEGRSGVMVALEDGTAIPIGGREGTSKINGIENVVGTGETDWIAGNFARNLLEGRGGDDLLVAVDGFDTLVGGHGEDTLRTMTDLGNTMDGGEGIDRVDYGDRDTKGMVIDLEGHAADRFTYRNAPVDRIGDVEDAVGTDGDDVILGDAADNELFGGAGEDTLDGRGGDDRLVGGDDADVFVWDFNAGLDRVADFKGGEDMIDLTALATDFQTVATTATILNGTDLALFYSPGDGLVLENTTLADIAADDFIF